MAETNISKSSLSRPERAVKRCWPSTTKPGGFSLSLEISISRRPSFLSVT
jgi:hypothetical protein